MIAWHTAPSRDAEDILGVFVDAACDDADDLQIARLRRLDVPTMIRNPAVPYSAALVAISVVMGSAWFPSGCWLDRLEVLLGSDADEGSTRPTLVALDGPTGVA